MIDRLKIVRAEGFLPYPNQAAEKYLLQTCRPGEMILYLWANDKTVFIGKNQNAFTECRLTALKEDGGYLARRFTGGGAVYHDKGNLNFTFVTCKEDYDIDNQFGVLESAMKKMGFPAERNGRNDVEINGKKFSGNAFYKSGAACLHHGTVLINSDGEAIAKYLNASRVKLNAKGVKSVKSRVCNLSDFRKDISAEEVSAELAAALKARYGGVFCEEFCASRLPRDEIKKLTAFFADENYTLGDDRRFGTQFEYRYEWGCADVRLAFNGNVIEDARIYSDALDTGAVELKEKLLKGWDLTKEPDPRIKDIIETIGAIGK